MPDLIPFERGPRPPRWPIVIIGACCLVLVLWLKLPGLVLATMIITAVFCFTQLRPDSPEVSSLRTSIRLSADEITEVQEEWGNYLNGSDTDSLADRTLHRPALADPDCNDPTIEKFHFEISNANRFLHRLDARLNAGPTVPQLEGLLKVTDERALNIRESWLAARKAAHRLGRNYGSGTDPENGTAG